MLTKIVNYNAETGEVLNLSKSELESNYVLISKSKSYEQNPFTIIWEKGWKASKNEQSRQ